MLLTAQKTHQNKSHTQNPTVRKKEVKGKRGQENGPKQKQDQTERATGLGRRTKKEIKKGGIKLTALRFQTRERHQNLWRSFGGIRAKPVVKMTSQT